MKEKKIKRLSTSEKRLQELSLLYKITSSMHTLDLNEILQLILEAVNKGIGFDRARLYAYDEKNNVLRFKMAVGLRKENIPEITLPLEKDTSIVARTFTNAKPYVVQDAKNDKRVNPDIVKLFNIQSFASAPLLARDKVKGVVTADNFHTKRIITEENLRSLVTFANHAGLAIENAEMYDKLQNFNRELGRQVKLTTKKLLKAQDELISKERLAALGELAAGIAHEIRNPLTSIKILINSLFSELPEKLRSSQDVNVINEEIERLNRIITQFLEFAKPQELIPEMIHIKNIISDTLTLIAPKTKKQNISVSLECPPGLPHLHGDPGLLKQAFLNLVLNAIQAMPEGGNLNISIKRIGSGKRLDMIKILLKDTGSGIYKDNIKKLFTPFFTTKKEGLGLGLSVTQKIINEHGGKIEIVSAVNKGTSLSVYLPLKIK